MTFKPTPEQTDCTEKFSTGKKLRINAYAGCGKTTVLKQIARSTTRRGVYVCFNKSIAEEARKVFPTTVACSTMHSLAYRAMARKYQGNKLTGTINGGYLAGKLSLQSRDVGPDITLTPRGVGYLIAATLKRWQASGCDELQEYDVPLDGRLECIDTGTAAQLRWDIASRARSLWMRMIDRNDEMPLGHDGYLKLWALGRPTLDGDFILLDEAQDTNGVVMELMRHQSAQLVTVGDKHQQIYEWRGARNAMVELPTDLEARLSTSFRFGPEIAGYASSVLDLLDETVPLKGNPARSDRIGQIERPDAILCRNNVTLLSELFDALEAGKRPCIVGGTTEVLSFVSAAEKLMNRQSVDYPLEFFGFKDWEDVREVAEKDEGAKELQRWVRLIDQYGVDKLRQSLERLPKQEIDADLVLSTGHKSKGREWPAVRLCDDFLRGIRTPKEDADKKALDAPPPSPEEYASELRLFYVAATRGQEQLEVHPSLQDKIEHLRQKRNEKAAAA